MRGLLRLLLWVSILVGGFIGILRLTAIRWIRLPVDDPVFEASIAPSVWGGDLILLWRIGDPEYTDLTLCPEPDYPERFVIGRIVGLPGDTVEFQDHVLLVNGTAFGTERNCDPTFFEVPHPDNPSEIVKQPCSIVDMGGHLHKAGSPGSNKVRPESLSFDVPAGSFFLASDNRLLPYDSRDYGFVPIESCKETVIARLVSRKGWMDSENRLRYVE